MIKDKGYVTVE